jgi:hypothetical protein
MMHHRLDTDDGMSAPSVVTARLDTLVGQAPRADAVAYLDVAAGTVLGTSSGAGQRQETLDALCALAGRLAGGPGGGAATVATRLETIVLAPAMPGRGDMLAFFFDPECPAETAREAAGAALESWPG